MPCGKIPVFADFLFCRNSNCRQQFCHFADFCKQKLFLQKLEVNKLVSYHKGISGVTVLQNWNLTKLEFNKTGVTFIKGTPGVSVLLEQQIVKNCFDAAHFHSFKNSPKEKKHSRSFHFCEFKTSTKHKWFSYSVWNF